jgi:hypothetical protein
MMMQDVGARANKSQLSRISYQNSRTDYKNIQLLTI